MTFKSFIRELIYGRLMIQILLMHLKLTYGNYIYFEFIFLSFSFSFFLQFWKILKKKL